MKSLRSKVEEILTAATFAESNEHETALRFLSRSESNEEATERAWARKSFSGSTEKKTGVRRALRDHFSAVAFAEAGAFETARRMLPDYRRKQAVLLAIEGEQPNEATFKYAVSLCRRISAKLDILQIVLRSSSEEQVPTEALEDLLFVAERNGVPVELTRRRVGANDVLYEHLRNHRNVSVAIVDSPRLRDTASKDDRWQETFRKITQKLSVPLVTASQR